MTQIVVTLFCLTTALGHLAVKFDMVKLLIYFLANGRVSATGIVSCHLT